MGHSSNEGRGLNPVTASTPVCASPCEWLRAAASKWLVAALPLILSPVPLLPLFVPQPAMALTPSFDVIADDKSQHWQLLSKASKAWRVCALLPNGRDKYWWGVSWGLAEEAKRLGLQMGIFHASSYADLSMQKRQWAECVAMGAQAYIIAAISADGLTQEIAEALSGGKPVIDLINGVSANTTSRSVVSFSDMASQTVNYLLRDAGGRQVRLAWFPGPDGAAWVQDGERGLMRSLIGSGVDLRFGGYGPTDGSTQSSLVRKHLELAGLPDYILGNAVAIEFAARYVNQRPAPRPKLLAYYATDEIVASIRNGLVLAAPTDRPVVQARISVDLAVRALQGESIPRRVGPTILMLDKSNVNSVDLSELLPPKGQWLVRQALPPK